MSKKYFLFTDIHSFYDILKQTLDKNGFDLNNQDHIFVSLGDLLDRGDGTKECLEFVNSIPNDRKILIRGNHEDLMERALERHYFMYNDFGNGTAKSVRDFTDSKNRELSDEEACDEFANDDLWKNYINKVINYKEFSNSIFVHGWIPCKSIVYRDNYYFNPDWRNSERHQWDDARWINGMKAANSGAIEPNKTIYCGHWHTSYGHSILENDGQQFLSDSIKSLTQINKDCNFNPYYAKGIVAMDACTAYSQKMNCIILNEEDL